MGARTDTFFYKQRSWFKMSEYIDDFSVMLTLDKIWLTDISSFY